MVLRDPTHAEALGGYGTFLWLAKRHVTYLLRYAPTRNCSSIAYLVLRVARRDCMLLLYAATPP
eukprot:2578473-Rhodomonas_salina.1